MQAQGMISAPIWAQLDFISAPYCTCCGLPFAFPIGEDIDTPAHDNSSGTVCMECLTHPPKFDALRSALIYNDASRRLLLGFKYGDKQHAAIPFARWMQLAGNDLILKSDYIVPIPLHWQRLWSRRFNQSFLLAKALHHLTKRPLLYNALQRKRFTGPQKGLSRRDRQKNVRMAFHVNPKYTQQIKGKNILLIDDVMTSGATLNECARLLKYRGAANVYGLTVARVLKDTHLSPVFSKTDHTDPDEWDL